LQVEPNRSFVFEPNDLSKSLESLANSQTVVTIRGQLYKKSANKKKADASVPLKLLLLEAPKEVPKEVPKEAPKESPKKE
jgi:hypothetical protein